MLLYLHDGRKTSAKWLLTDNASAGLNAAAVLARRML